MKHILLSTLALGFFVMTVSATPSGGGNGQGCSIQLFDGDDFDETDDNVTIAGPGRFANLRDLPDTTEDDWGGEADSFRVGSAATVQVYAQEDFGGATQTYQPGTEQSDADEFYSVEITCG